MKIFLFCSLFAQMPNPVTAVWRSKKSASTVQTFPEEWWIAGQILWKAWPFVAFCFREELRALSEASWTAVLWLWPPSLEEGIILLCPDCRLTGFRGASSEVYSWCVCVGGALMGVPSQQHKDITFTNQWSFWRMVAGITCNGIQYQWLQIVD